MTRLLNRPRHSSTNPRRAPNGVPALFLMLSIVSGCLYQRGLLDHSAKRGYTNYPSNVTAATLADGTRSSPLRSRSLVGKRPAKPTLAPA